MVLMRMPASVHLLTTKIVLPVGSLTRHALELLASWVLSGLRYVGPIVRHLRHVVAGTDLDGMRAVTRYL